jgi:hypothetical protein
MKIDLNRLGHIATVFAALIAAVALFIQMYESNKLIIENKTDEWKKTVVFTIISNASFKGALIDEILDGYEGVVTDKFTKIDLLAGSKLSESELISIILELKKANMVFKSQEGSFKESISSDLVQAKDINLRAASFTINKILVEMLNEKPCFNSATELINIISSKTGIQSNLISATINSNIGGQTISLNLDDKVCLMQDYNPMQVMQKNFNTAWSDFNKAKEQMNQSTQKYESLITNLMNQNKEYKTLTNDLIISNKELLEMVRKKNKV